MPALAPAGPWDARPSRLVICSISSSDSGRLWVPRCTGLGAKPPPPQSGQRVTTTLSRRGARALQDASRKAIELGHGFRAHWGFTLGAESRSRLQAGEFTLGSEVRRTLGLLQHWNERHEKPRLLNEWVAENPDEDGHENPHLHMNLDYISRRQDFRKYAAYVEEAWGHGYVHMERLRDPRAAAAYLLKCVGYVSKGVQSGQGRIVGNRYGMSQSLRSHREEATLVQDDSGRINRSLYRLTTLREGQEYADLGRGVFATRYGIGTKLGSPVQPSDLAEFLYYGGRWR